MDEGLSLRFNANRTIVILISKDAKKRASTEYPAVAEK